MKKKTAYLITSILNFIGGFSFLLSAVFQEYSAAKWGFFVAAVCLIISAAGFLYMYFKNKKD